MLVSLPDTDVYFLKVIREIVWIFTIIEEDIWILNKV